MPLLFHGPVVVVVVVVVVGVVVVVVVVVVLVVVAFIVVVDVVVIVVVVVVVVVLLLTQYASRPQASWSFVAPGRLVKASPDCRVCITSDTIAEVTTPYITADKGQ